MRDLEQGRNRFSRQVELNTSEVECGICTDKFGVREAIRFLPCQHGWYCIECVQNSVQAKMAEGKSIGHIHCLECKEPLSEALLRALLPRKQLERLHKQSVDAALGSCGEMKACPTP